MLTAKKLYETWRQTKENLDSNEEVQGQNILPQDPDPDLESKKESTIVVDDDDDDDTTALDVTLSDTGIKGTKICPIRTSSNETEDPLQVMVDQCNEENDFGNARYVFLKNVLKIYIQGSRSHG